jgi:PAS domain S-box-containing protein
MEFFGERLMKLLRNILSGGRRGNHDIEMSRRIMIANALSIIGIIMLILMGFIGLAQNNPLLFITDLIVAALLIINMLYLRRLGEPGLIFRLSVISFVAVFFYYLFVSGGVENTSFVWVYTFPLLACFVLGSRRGIYASLVFFLFLLAFMFFDTHFPNAALYMLNFKIRLVASYLVVSFFAFAFEKMRELSQCKLEEKNKELLNSIERLRIMDTDLRRAGEELERRVLDRTAELSRLNRQLIEETEERKRSEKSLHESEQRYRHLIANAPAGIYELDLKSNRLISVNDVMCRLSGYTKEEFLSLDPMQLLTEESRSIFMQRQAAIFAGKPVPASVEYAVRSKDGQEFWVILSSEFSYEPEGGIKAMVVMSDITERKRVEAERIQLERRLLDSQRLESLGILAGGIAHDFNNLLMAILGNLEIAQINLPATSSARLSVGQAIQATRRAADLTRQMLAYSGKGSFLIKPMDLNELVRENTELFRTVVCKTVTMSLELSNESAVVKADPGQVQQVIMNLITNASEAIGDKQGDITIATEILDCNETFLEKSLIQEKVPAGRYVCLKVTDDGQGMDEKTISRIFDPFFSTKFTGRGLGMSVVLGIVRGHKGAIIIESMPGRGTTVQVLFPAGEAVAEIHKPSSNISSAATPSGTILVVDDEEMVRSVCEVVLQRLGYKTLSAADGEEALMFLQKHSTEIVLVLLDLTMPKMDGYRTFQEMRRIRPDIRIILCSGYGEEAATERFVHSGLNGFIKKPFQIGELKEKIAEALGGLDTSASTGI